MYAVIVSHSFEAGHRLPHLGGKCTNLHGHTWRYQVEVSGPALSPSGTLVEFADLKRGLRAWVDASLDHGCMLGAADPLVPVLVDHGCRVFPFGGGDPYTEGIPWPTVEGVAVLISRVADDLLSRLTVPTGVEVSRVEVQETPVNRAIWEVDRSVWEVNRW